MRMVSRGQALFKVPETGEVIALSVEKMAWRRSEGSDVVLGPNFRYAAALAVEGGDGRLHHIAWEVFEYPVGCIAVRNVTHHGLELLTDFQSVLVSDGA